MIITKQEHQDITGFFKKAGVDVDWLSPRSIEGQSKQTINLTEACGGSGYFHRPKGESDVSR